MIRFSQSPHPKKHFGQHFLGDSKVCQDIVALLGPTEDLAAILEVGPGQGALTRYLAPGIKAPLHLVEIDPDMVAYLKTNYPHASTHLHERNFITFPLHTITQGEIALVGNLPYNVASQILLHALDYRHQVIRIVCMVQREVAQRIASSPGSKRYGLLSVWIQAFYQVSYAFEVPPEAFTPPPKVTSAVLSMERRRTKLPCDEKVLFKIAKTAFQQRRKMLSNALAPLGRPLDLLPPSLRTQRAEQLDVEDFIHITNLLAL